MIILLITAVYSSLSQFKWITKEKLYENMGLLFIIPLCSVIALSNVVTFNNSVLFTYTLPGPLMKLWGIFQATERMVWPIFYLLMTFAIYQTSKGLGRNYKIALVLLFAFIIQYSDVAPRLQERHAIFSNPQDKVSPLKSAFWNDALKYYNSLVLLPLSMDNWEWITYYAVQNHLKINYSYMARVSKFIPEAANKKISLLESGHYQEGELYVIKDDSTLQRLCGAFHKSAFFANVDSEWVIAPNFNKTYADYPDITITGDNFSCDTYRLSDYLSKYKNQLIIISAKDDASGAIDEQTVIAFKRIGLSADLRGMLRKSYIGITYDGKPLYEAIVDYKVEFYAQKKQVINGFQMPFDIKVVSAGLLSGEQMAYININGVNYSLNKRGLNIVVYDPNINQVIDVSHFDTEQILTNYPVP
jgi:hypothetical protein